MGRAHLLPGSSPRRGSKHSDRVKRWIGPPPAEDINTRTRGRLSWAAARLHVFFVFSVLWPFLFISVYFFFVRFHWFLFLFFWLFSFCFVFYFKFEQILVRFEICSKLFFAQIRIWFKIKFYSDSNLLKLILSTDSEFQFFLRFEICCNLNFAQVRKFWKFILNKFCSDSEIQKINVHAGFWPSVSTEEF
jgi:hypothetical protein